MSNLDFIYKRHSVRKFKDEDVPLSDIKTIIKAAHHAPSAKNVQNWHFVVIKDKKKIDKLAEIIEQKNAKLAQTIQDKSKRENFTKFVRFATLFKNAPVTILLYAAPYTATGIEVLKKSGASNEEVNMLVRSSPEIQNIGAAMENLILAAAEMDYGTCWMTSQNYAAKEIEEFVQLNLEGYFFAAITPLGVPEGEIQVTPRKPLKEVMTVIE